MNTLSLKDFDRRSPAKAAFRRQYVFFLSAIAVANLKQAEVTFPMTATLTMNSTSPMADVYRSSSTVLLSSTSLKPLNWATVHRREIKYQAQGSSGSMKVPLCPNGPYLYVHPPSAVPILYQRQAEQCNRK